jgi:formate dehydrogenase major subunit
VLEKLSGSRPLEYDAFIRTLQKGGVNGAIVTGNYPSDWVLAELADSLRNVFTLVIDTLPTRLTGIADVVLPGATWAEKAGTFENVKGRLQAFDRAIDPIDYCKSEAQIALDLLAEMTGESPWVYNPVDTRQELAREHSMNEFITSVHLPKEDTAVESDMHVVEL